ncbi:hypothetical protein ACFSBZ_14420 [Amnibacterium flavum]|uniref:Uncharacterized protein n=1 Tax=Amnibacterium flavum TaxID=2173173 RepID=A0A2V1HXB1_9MICO|nr:hypothetical protein [Amnibacterium flavum]PVZ95939.1 hypothetical protein DDQ50_05620 [Amnibacterium flavum]
MRWESLFDDLEAQLEHERTAGEGAFSVDTERHRLAELSLADRLRALPPGTAARIRLLDGRTVHVLPQAFGSNWLSGELRPAARPARTVVIPIGAIAGVLLDPYDETHMIAAPPEAPSSLSRKLGIGVVLRDLCRRRATVQVSTAAGESTGTIDRVTGDHLDLAVHEPDSPRRSTAVRSIEMIPLAAVLLVTC